MATNIRIRSVIGPAIEEWIPALARLRIEIFREFPYLYDGDEDYERRYLSTYIKTDTSIAVLALCGDEVVGASTGLAMADEESAFVAPFAEAGFAIDTIFYCAESVLRPELHTQFDWKDVDEQASSPKPMAFYTKALAPL